MTARVGAPVWIPRLALLAAHADQIRTHGGEHGLRDEGLLESALARPEQRWHYAPESDLAELAAAYGFGLAKNHPFVDGNKRLAFVAINMFLILNGVEIEATEPEVVDTMVGVASGAVDEAELASWIRVAARPVPN